jgi:CheY-like chemotaxis protein
VESAPGQGSTFSLYFPLQHKGNARLSSRPAPAVGGSEQIMVVDDEPVQLRTARRLLEHLGYSVVTAGSGEAALTLLATCPGQSKYDLVILDMMMPGMDGLATLERIRQVCPKQKALLVTGYTPRQMIRSSADNELVWLTKPYTPKALGKAVRCALDNSTQHSG